MVGRGKCAIGDWTVGLYRSRGLDCRGASDLVQLRLPGSDVPQCPANVPCPAYRHGENAGTTLPRKLAWGQIATLCALAIVVVIWASGNTLSGSAIRQWLDVAASARHYAIGWIALWVTSLGVCATVLRHPLSLPLRISLAISAMALCWLMRWTLLIQVQTVPKFNAQFNPYILPGGTDGWLAILGTFGLWVALIIMVREALNAIARRMQHG